MTTDRFKSRPKLGALVQLPVERRVPLIGVVRGEQPADEQRVRVWWPDGLSTVLRCEQLRPAATEPRADAAPDAVRALIAEAETHLANVHNCSILKERHDDLIERLTAALSAYLPQEDADLDAIEERARRHQRDFSPYARVPDGLTINEVVQRAIGAVTHMAVDVEALLARVRTAEAERDQARATVTRLNRRAQEAESKVARSEALAARVGSIEQVRKFLADQGVDGLQELADRSRTVETAEETGASLIIIERARQVDEEGYDAEHDRGHARELVNAAQVYAMFSEFVIRSGEAPDGHAWAIAPDDHGYPSLWPWHADYWKPTGDPIRDLTKAGALIAAAIDSLRLPPVPPTPEEQPNDLRRLATEFLRRPATTRREIARELGVYVEGDGDPATLARIRERGLIPQLRAILLPGSAAAPEEVDRDDA